MNKKKLHLLNIKSLDHLSFLLGFPKEKILQVCDNISNYYRSVDKLIKGKKRHIDEPISLLRIIDDNLQRLLSRIDLPSYITGGRKNFSIVKNAEPHLGKTAVLKYDIESFFPSIHYTRVYKLFIDLGCSWKVARVLTRLTTYNGCVPHGSPTSTTIANLCILPLSNRINILASYHDCDYSQFVDDGTISGKGYIENLRPLIDRIIKQEGFKASPKQHKRETLYWDDEQIVCGVKVNKSITAPSEYIRKVYDEIEALKKEKKLNKSISETKIRSIRGKVQHIKNLDKKKGEKLQQKFRCFL